MDGDRVELVERVGASLLEVLVPRLAVRGVGGGGAHKIPSLLFEGHQVLFDERAAILGTHVGLPLLVDLVHGHGALVLVELGTEVVEHVLLE